MQETLVVHMIQSCQYLLSNVLYSVLTELIVTTKSLIWSKSHAVLVKVEQLPLLTKFHDQINFFIIGIVYNFKKLHDVWMPIKSTLNIYLLR